MSREAKAKSITTGIRDYVGNFAVTQKQSLGYRIATSRAFQSNRRARALCRALCVAAYERSRWRSHEVSSIKYSGRPHFCRECTLRPARLKTGPYGKRNAKSTRRRLATPAARRMLTRPMEFLDNPQLATHRPAIRSPRRRLRVTTTCAPSIQKAAARARPQ